MRASKRVESSRAAQRSELLDSAGELTSSSFERRCLLSHARDSPGANVGGSSAADVLGSAPLLIRPKCKDWGRSRQPDCQKFKRAMVLIRPCGNLLEQ